MGYRDTFISVAEDCRAATGEVPPERGSGPTVAGVQHAMLAREPGRWTQEDVLIASAPGGRGRTDLDPAELQRLKAEYFAPLRASLRASPLGEERLAAVLAGMSGHLAQNHDAEAAAVIRLGAALGS